MPLFLPTLRKSAVFFWTLNWAFRHIDDQHTPSGGILKSVVFYKACETDQTPSAAIPPSESTDTPPTHSVPNWWQCETESDIPANTLAPAVFGLPRLVCSAHRVCHDVQRCGRSSSTICSYVSRRTPHLRLKALGLRCLSCLWVIIVCSSLTYF